ncbi:MAG: Acetate kinase [Acidobacteria bacterium]|nr:Acetate kinase [Acidobacteriota bacterium]
MNILVANIGSTSFKYRLYQADGSEGTAVAQGRIERIGQPGSACPDYETAIRLCTGDIAGEGRPLASLSDLSAVGFKAVHAGPVGGARVVDDAVLAAMEEFAFFAPAHNPPYVAAMRSFRRALPGVPLVALFETAFFDALDEAATTYAVPYAWREDLGVRRYGFHGASHRAAAEHARAIVGPGARHISCHLGGSSSVAAIRDGVAVDTSFGMSPQSGLPQNNRTGDLDVFAALFVMKRRGLGVDEMARVLSTGAGLAGVSGLSGDVRDLDEAAVAGNPRARLALDVYVRAIRHYLGAFLVELGGLDVLTFSGGIGENSPAIRAGVCRGLGTFGIVLDEGVNAATRAAARISPAGSPVTVLVVPADEERIVARATAEVVAGRQARAGGPHGA